MQKCGVTKYTLDWQTTRVLAKDFKTVEEKMAHVRAFFNSNPSKQQFVRVVNYLEGLHMGYRKKNEVACRAIEAEIVKYGSMDDYAWDDEDGTIRYRWTDKQLIKCYKDNMKRYTNYASKGYFHKEIYNFCKSFSFADIELIERFKAEAESKENTHHFFF